MTDDVTDHVRRLLSDAASVLDAARPSPGEAVRVDELDPRALRELGEEAADVLEATDPETLLDALGLGGADGPGSVPEAILTGDADHVAELRALLALSRLAPGEGTAIDSPFEDDDRETLRTLGDLLTEQAGDDSNDRPEGTTEEPASGDTARETLAETSDEITSALRTALDDARTGLGDVLGEDSLLGDEGLLGAHEDDEDEGLLDVETGAMPSGEEARSLATGDSADARESVSGYGRSTYSTVPSQDRPDMAGVRRYSTMADR